MRSCLKAMSAELCLEERVCPEDCLPIAHPSYTACSSNQLLPSETARQANRPITDEVYQLIPVLFVSCTIEERSMEICRMPRPASVAYFVRWLRANSMACEVHCHSLPLCRCRASPKTQIWLQVQYFDPTEWDSPDARDTVQRAAHCSRHSVSAGKV